MLHRLCNSLCILSLVFSGVGSASAVPLYNITDLGTLGGVLSFASDINNSGQVVGEARDASNHTRAFLYSNGTMIDLGTIGGDPNHSESFAYGINTDGQVVGYTLVQEGNMPPTYAFLYDHGDLINLGTLPGTSYTNSMAHAINDSAQVVGVSLMGSSGGRPIYHAFLYINGTMTDLGAPVAFPSSVPYAINNNGQVVGSMTNNTSNITHAFFYNNGSMIDMGTLPGDTLSEAVAINNNGQVVGTSSATNQHAFLYANGTMTGLGTLTGFSRSFARDINNGGKIVGDVATADFSTRRAVLYSGGTITDLNSLINPDLGWSLGRADAINDSGWIVGTGQHNGNTRAFLLIPIPEPSTFALLGIGALGLFTYAWRRRKELHNQHSTILAIIVVLIAGSARADVFNMGGTRDPVTGTWTGLASLEFVTIDDPGNVADTSGYGSVPYVYQMRSSGGGHHT
ncbi:MAG: DUF3466 family protein [Pirellulales bacterium]|nr:DUF3466 family protein [Pirellulales bacterium]